MAETGAYKWMLRKGGKKMECPKCHQMRFVPYVLASDGKTIAKDGGGNAIYGRCDREDNCRYHLYPGKEIEPNAVATPIVHKEPIVFRSDVIKVNCDDILFDWVASTIGKVKAEILWHAYNVGSLDRKTIWWQMDINGRVKAGKVMEYGNDGHRVKDDLHPYAVNWCHKNRKFNDWYDGEELEQCWFGEHLLTRHPDKPVAIVESEKTALMMAAWSKPFVWIAAGGSQGIKSDRKAKVLDGRKVVLIPDNGKWWEWREVAKKHGWECRHELEDEPLFQGCDILDMCLEWRKQLLDMGCSTWNIGTYKKLTL